MPAIQPSPHQRGRQPAAPPSYRVPSRGGAGHDLEGLLDPGGPRGHHTRCHSTVAWCTPSSPMGLRASHLHRRSARRPAAQESPGRATGQTQDALRQVVHGGAPSSPATRTVSRSAGAGGHPRRHPSSPESAPGPSLSDHAHAPFRLPESTFMSPTPRTDSRPVKHSPENPYRAHRELVQSEVHYLPVMFCYR